MDGSEGSESDGGFSWKHYVPPRNKVTYGDGMDHINESEIRKLLSWSRAEG